MNSSNLQQVNMIKSNVESDDFEGVDIKLCGLIAF